ncbi:hypothetical protein C9975_03445 [Thalassospira xiamenensis]|nr:hypothetical protein C9975_03445 [Thalassospira xiamenensis]
MCRMSLEQYKEAERLFEVSFSFAKKKGYRENRHLENQWARFLLESRTNTNDYIDFAQSFNEAHKICLKQIRNEPKSYNPFRVASDYLPFIERRIADLDNHALISTLRSCNELMRAIRSTDKSIEAHAVVEQGRKSIEKSIEIIVDNLRSKGYDFVK